MDRTLPTTGFFALIPRQTQPIADGCIIPAPASNPAVVLPSREMAESVSAVENILSYRFKNKKLLEEALTHSSCTESPSYQRLEFLGDMVLGLAFSNYVYLAYPMLDQGKLSLLRAANVSGEKLARVALKHGLHRFLRHNASSLDGKVMEFAEAVTEEDDLVPYGGSVKAPKVLADIVESVAGAIYIDVNFDLQRLWVIFRGLLEPVVTLEDLQMQPQPVTLLFELCQKHSKHVAIKYWRKGKETVASVYVDGGFISSGSSEQKDTAKLNAVKAAIHKLSETMSIKVDIIDAANGLGYNFETETGKQTLHEICSKKRWPMPTYSIEKDEGPPHDKKFVCSVKIPISEGTLYMEGYEKSRVKDSENSAASLMIQALHKNNYLQPW